MTLSSEINGAMTRVPRSTTTRTSYLSSSTMRAFLSPPPWCVGATGGEQGSNHRHRRRHHRSWRLNTSSRAAAGGHTAASPCSLASLPRPGCVPGASLCESSPPFQQLGGAGCRCSVLRALTRERLVNAGVFSSAAATTGCGGVHRCYSSERAAARLGLCLCASHLYICATEELQGTRSSVGADKWQPTATCGSFVVRGT